MSDPNPPSNQRFVGRGAQMNPANRFLPIHQEDDWGQFEEGDESLETRLRVQTLYFIDDSQTIVSENDSPDIPFRYSINPYRGCAHGCSYCYARPTHEYLGFSAGVDFESKILVKERAPELLRGFLNKKSWKCETIVLSGVTDCYQPAERKFQLARRCLEVGREYLQPMSVITKNALITRDLDVLGPMAVQGLTRAAISITSLDQRLTRVLEPRTSSPAARLNAVRSLVDAGVSVTVMVAPIIPGLNDTEIPAILEAAKEHGASYAGYILLRLPLTVRPVFLDWLAGSFPDKRQNVESLIRSTRDGQYNQTGFQERMRGTGEYAEHIRKTFQVFARRFQLDGKPPPLNTSLFRRPSAQPWLFDDSGMPQR